MKKHTILVLLVLSIALVLGSVAPASAASLHMSANAKTHVLGLASRVDFTARVSRRSSVRVTLYKGSKTLRTLKAKKFGSKYLASWNLKDSAGHKVASGTYGYVVTAAASSARKTVRGKVSVPTAPVAAPLPPGGRFVGFYVSGNMSSASGLNTIESEIGTRAAVVNMFVSDSESFPTDRCQVLASRGSIPLVTLEFWSVDGVGVDAINNGSKDAYIRSFADKAKAFGGEVWLRPFHEFNGDWYPWCGTVGSNTPAKVAAAYRHVHDIFAAEGASNVKFVWCANSDNCPGTSANAVENYWPGDSYVDYVAIDAYNWGSAESWSSWRSFASAVGGQYQHLSALTSKPMFIAETGCAEQGGNKAQWITDMFNAIRNTYTRIQGVCWFNVHDTNEDWRIESSSSALSSFATAAKAGY